MNALQGRVAVVGGGGGGMGQAAAELFARAGATVVVIDRDEPAAQGTRDRIREGGGQADAIVADLSDRGAVDAAFDRVVADHQRVDVLYNHAGTVIVKPFLDTSESEWDALMATNVKSMVFTCQAAIPHMIANGGGAIVNMASVSGVAASPMEAAYCVSKAAVIQLTRAIAVEFRDQGIRCNCLCPSLVRTAHGQREMAQMRALGVDIGDEVIQAGQGRICEPEEVGQAALFLASPESSFVNGAALFVDNGWTAGA